MAVQINVRVQVSHNNIPNVIKAIELYADTCTEAIAKAVQDEAQQRAPVLTGRLKTGIQVESAGQDAHVVYASSIAGGADREYAEYNEFGTRYMGAQPFFREGYEAAKVARLPAAITAYVARIEEAA
jgi:HK97 gp10 family phage protein